MIRHLFRAALAAVLLAAGAAGAQEPIRIGSVLSLTGPAAFLGDPELKTLQMLVEKLNAEGGVLGRKYQLVHYDDGSDASKANAFAKRLIEQDRVDFMVGGTTTGATMAMVPLVEKAGVPFISMAGGVAIVEPVKKWVFKTPHTDRMAAEKVFEDMKKRGITRVGLLSETSGFGQSGRKETQAAAQRLGITLAGDETYGPKDTDMTAQLTKLRAAPGIQALFVFGLGQGPAIVTKNVQQLAIKLPLYHAHGVASDEFIRLAGAAAEGVRLPAAALIVAKQLPAADPQKPVVMAYDKAYRERFKEDVSTFGGHAWDGLMILHEAIRRAGSADREKVRDAIEATRNHMGTGGLVNFSATDHLGLDLSAFRMVEIRNGDWVLAN
ncbi:MAG: ABC transporter substrate-binding protein [Betaproteobacteria bacterium]|jgi:branched-chain amino acid transport system substrate-binding protein|nr:ABC transporter substrate-binding protein [Rhodocyclaceae bacterium]MCA3134364.1 ABC transporter substrate-binding protein [Rhodocyclaceae bacterium]MCA3141173.1 ABC transporter substrate-binding protein [Rhodocyclaceae bacterium]MCA3145072.1 ABC transporter substrate-binding protein [Rhodocyclaceae bacterium]MCE2897919.1 ABC transporter substrate-binding protein [Betaproteobacteria bacterium]